LLSSTITDCVTLVPYGWMKAGIDGVTRVALAKPRKIYNRRAYDNVHYVPVLAA
jgi:hypothetical protein